MGSASAACGWRGSEHGEPCPVAASRLPCSSAVVGGKGSSALRCAPHGRWPWLGQSPAVLCCPVPREHLCTLVFQLMHKLSVEAPPKILVERYLIEIAKNYNVPYEPDSVVMVSEALQVCSSLRVFVTEFSH